ncbi:MAG: hypothetical protein M1817_001887 [Caeruleum heppii]|nr:MAG: hypothetical protein M1817_001887 [Caeruleum heppii]
MDKPEALPHPQPRAPLFSEVIFFVVRHRQLPHADAQRIAAVLKENGGTECPASAAGSEEIPSQDITHIISSTPEFPDYHRATDVFIPVVTPAWVETSLAKRRLVPLRAYTPDPRLFFSGVTVFCENLPFGDVDAINAGVTAFGGQFASVMSKLVTHIIALNEDEERRRQIDSKRLQCKVVLPHWFDDCLKHGKRLDEQPYSLTEPGDILTTLDDSLVSPASSKLRGAHSSEPGAIPTMSQSPASRNLSVFQSKRVMLSSDLNLGRRLRGIIEELIGKGGGAISNSVRETDMLVCHYREGREYRSASRIGKDVGNLPWLYHLMAYNSWTSPMRRLLHYPVVRGGMTPFRDFRISVSNYGGDARVYLENLVRAAGGEFTKTMRGDNTHLITARAQSEKCSAAKEWGIHMINHLWLEESYAKWEIQSLTDPRYTQFPVRNHQEEGIGQTQIARRAVEEMFFLDDDDDGSEGDEPRGPAHASEEASHTPANEDVDMAEEPLDAIRSSGDRERPVHDSSKKSTPSGPKASRKQLHATAPKTPSARRPDHGGKENGTPFTSCSRSAKDRAVAKLHNLAPDIALYEKEKKRVGGVIFGGRKASDETRVTVKRRSSSRQSSTETEDETDDNRQVKRQKKTRSPLAMRLAMTSYKRWTNQPKVEERDKKRLRELGILVVEAPSKCTHLAAPSIIRTPKFVSALAFAPVVLSTTFIDRCLEEDELLPTKGFLLEDVDTEKRLGFRLKDALGRAKANKQHLLRNFTIYCTSSVPGGFDAYKSIVEVNGGRCNAFRARHVPGSRGIMDDDESEDEDAEVEDREAVYLLSGESAEEQRQWDVFRQMVRAAGHKPRVARVEWLLLSAMSQRVVWNEQYELGPER